MRGDNVGMDSSVSPNPPSCPLHHIPSYMYSSRSTPVNAVVIFITTLHIRVHQCFVANLR